LIRYNAAIISKKISVRYPCLPAGRRCATGANLISKMNFQGTSIRDRGTEN
jgi:hypothetical protein